MLNVDDDPSALTLKTTLLQDAGFPVIEARTGMEALRIAAATPLDAAILDIQLPDIDGFTVCARLRAAPATASIPVIHVTAAHRTVEDVRRGIEAGADYYLVQPVEPEVLITIVRALIARREATDALRLAAADAERALARSEARYRSLVTHAAIGIYQATRGGRFRTVNPALVSMLGYESEAELLDVPLRNIYAEPSERDAVLRQFAAGSGGQADAHWRRKDGRLVTVSLTGRMVTSDERTDTGEEVFEVFVEDVTERRGIEARLRQVQKLEAIGRFAGGVAHDFNNMLTAILGFTDMVLDELRENEQLRADVTEIRNAAQRAVTLTQRLLTFSRQQMLRVTTVDLNATIQSLMPMLHRLIGEDIETRLDLEPSLASFKGDAALIEQLIMNIAVNARDAMPSGGRLGIATSMVYLDEAYVANKMPMTPGTYLQLTISDTGVGMDADTRSRLFEPFFTTKPIGMGTGLGLATVYGIVKQFGGFIWVYSEEGKGTVFKIHLPAAVGAPAALAPPVMRSAIAAGHGRILVVEDNPSVRRLTVAALSRHGYEVIEATSGPDAINRLNALSGEVDLVLTDVVMPRMSGREMVDRVLADYPGMPVLFMSGFTDRMMIDEDILAAGVDIIQKPFTPRMLLDRVETMLSRQRRRTDGSGMR